MADEQYTSARLRDGTTLRFKGQLNPDEVKAKVAAYRASQAPQQELPHESWGDPFRHQLDGPGPIERGFTPPVRDVPPVVGAMERSGMGRQAPMPEPPVPRPNIYNAQGQVVTRGMQMTGEPTVKDYLATMANMGTSTSTETGGSGAPLMTMDPHYLWDRKYRAPLADVPEMGTMGAEVGQNLMARRYAAAGAGALNLAGEALSPLMGPEVAEGGQAARGVLKGLATGTVLGEGGKYAARKLGASQDVQELAGAAGFWLPAGYGTLKGALGGRPIEARPAPTPEEFLAQRHIAAAEGSPGPAPQAAPEPTPPSEKSEPAKVAGTPVLPSEPSHEPVTDLVKKEAHGAKPQEGEVVTNRDRKPAEMPDKAVLKLGAYKQLEYSQQKLREVIAKGGDEQARNAANKQVIADAQGWARYAEPEEIANTMQVMTNRLNALGNHVGLLKDLSQGLLTGKVSFFDSEDPSVQKITQKTFNKILGTTLPPVPKGYFDTLPEEVRNGIPEKGIKRREAIGRYWAAENVQRYAGGLYADWERVYDLQNAVAMTRGARIPSKEQLLAKHVTDPTAATGTEVGRAVTSTEVAQPKGEPVQAAQTPARPGEPVPPAKGPEVSPFDEMAAYQPGRGAHAEPPLGTSKEPPNYFLQAQQELRSALGREATTSEIMKHAEALKAKATGVDPEFTRRVDAMTRRGVAQGTAERQVREQMAEERHEAKIREQQAARPSERGSLSFRRLQPFIGPRGPSPFWRLSNFLDRLSNLGTVLEKSPNEERARDITRESASKLALEHLRLEARLKEAINRHDADGEAEFRTFMDVGEGKGVTGWINWSNVIQGGTHLGMNLADIGVAQELHQMFQERWQHIQYILDKAPGGIENYLAHLWKRPGLAKRGLEGFFGRRPLEGNKTFLRQRFYDYASDGLDKGLEPITYNPIRMQLTALFQMDKFIAAHELKDMYQAAGLAEWVPNGDTSHMEWEKLDDKIFQPKQRLDSGGLVQWGQYKAPPDVAKIFNRYVAPGLRGNPTYDAVRKYGNLLNQINLGVSGYHGLFVAFVAGASDSALGVQKIFNNFDVGGGLKDIARGTLGSFFFTSAVNDWQFGKKIQREAINPTGDPGLQKYVDMLTSGGARFDQDPLYETNFRKFWTAIKTGHPIEALQTGVQNLSKPIMKLYVPRVKLGMAAKMMDAKMEYLDRQGITDQATIDHEMGKVWDSVDNRAGQMVYDNLFWNKAAKDLSFLAVRAVGWDYGSGREYLGAGKDLVQQTAKALRGERPEITDRMAFPLGVLMTIGTMGAITTYMVTRKPPQSLEDYFYPYSGRIGANGKLERMSFPSYMKDVFSVAHDLGHGKADTAIHKLHPMWNQLAELLTNKDFYNTEIRSEGDPAWAQALQVGKWYGKSFLPFSYTMANMRTRQGIPAAEAYGESFFGIQRAPAYVTESPAEEMTLDFAKRNWKAGPLTTREREQRDTYNFFRDQAATGKLDTKALSDAYRAGKLRESDVDRMFEDQGLSSFEREFKSLKLPESIKVFQLANKDERQHLKPLLVDKEDQLDEFRVPEERAYYAEQLQKALQ